MSCLIDETMEMPAYLQLYQSLRTDIVQGVYPYGSKMPSKRTLAAETGVSVITVEHAYALLCEEGYLEARQRSGYFVLFHGADGFALPAEKSPYHRAHPHGAHTSEEFPFSVLAKTMRRVINDYEDVLLRRSPNAGCLVFREALKQYLARNRGIYADIEQIIIGSGAEYLYGILAGVLGRKRIYALEDPSYEKIYQVYEMEGIQCDLLPLGKDGIESNALWHSQASVLHISPYRSFPTGITASASKRYEYIRWAMKGERFIIEDDFESEFTISTKPEETLFSLSKKENVIYLNTFSKTISPSLRVGYMVLPKQLLPAFEKKAGFYSCTVPTFEQFVLAELIAGGDFERHINRVRRQKRKLAAQAQKDSFAAGRTEKGKEE